MEGIRHQQVSGKFPVCRASPILTHLWPEDLAVPISAYTHIYLLIYTRPYLPPHAAPHHTHTRERAEPNALCMASCLGPSVL